MHFPASKTHSLSSGHSRATDLAAALILSLIALCAYSNSFLGPFVFDDTGSITKNPSIQSLWPPWKMFHPPMGDGETVGGRPLLNVSFAINYALGGTNVVGYHIGNLLIHIAAGLVLLGIVRRTLRLISIPESLQEHSGPIAFAIATMWTVHPLQTQSVTYIVQRAESLMGLFYLLTLYGFIRGATSLRSRAWLGFSIAASLMGMASKEVMVTAPVMVFLYDRAFISGSIQAAWKRHGKYYVGLATTWILLIWLVWENGGSRGTSAGLASNSRWSDYLLTQCEAITTYLRLAVVPVNQIFDYGTDLVTRLSDVTGSITVIASLLLATLYATWRWPKLGFLGIWFFAILSPSSLVPIPSQTIDEHRVYLSLASVMIGIVLLVHRARPRLAIAIIFCITGTYVWLTLRRNRDFSSNFALCSDTVKKRPTSWRAHNWLGDVLPQTPENVPVKIAHFRTAIKLAPKLTAAYSNLANLLIKIPGKEEEAFDLFETAIRLEPSVAGSHCNFANALLYFYGGGLSKRDADHAPRSERDRKWREPSPQQPGAPLWLSDAIEQLETALKLDPTAAVAQNNLGNAYQKIEGAQSLAIQHFEEAIRLDPRFAEPSINLGNIWLKMPGKTTEAIVCFEHALILAPDSVDAHNGLASALRQIPGRLPEAIQHYQAALKLAPDLSLLHYNLAGTYAEDGRFDESIGELQTALRLTPNFPEASQALKTLEEITESQPTKPRSP